jgi:hypothetical protein
MIEKCWILGREENRITQRKTHKARDRTNKQLYSHVMQSLGIEPQQHWQELSSLIATPPMLPNAEIITENDSS